MSALNSTSHSPGAAPDITWAPFPGCEEKAIELPTMEDSLQDLAVKMRRLSEVVINNYSLAFSTAFKATQYSTSDPVKLAIPRMNPLELREYQAWTKEPTFPGWNKDTCKLDRANWDLSGEAKLQEWTEAVRLMFNDPTLEREHTVYLYTEVKVLVPIITAHIKLNTAIRQLTVKDADLTANEFAEYKTAKKITSVAAANVQTSNVRARALTRDIAAANAVIRGRLGLYKGRLAAVTMKSAKNTPPTVKPEAQAQQLTRARLENRLPLSCDMDDAETHAQGFLDRLDEYLRTSANPSFIPPDDSSAPNTEDDELAPLRQRARSADAYRITAKRPFPGTEPLYDSSTGRKRLTSEDTTHRHS